MKMINSDEYRKLQRLVFDLILIIEKNEEPTLPVVEALEHQVDEFVPLDIQLEFIEENKNTAAVAA